MHVEILITAVAWSGDANGLVASVFSAGWGWLLREVGSTSKRGGSMLVWSQLRYASKILNAMFLAFPFSACTYMLSEMRPAYIPVSWLIISSSNAYIIGMAACIVSMLPRADRMVILVVAFQLYSESGPEMKFVGSYVALQFQKNRCSFTARKFGTMRVAGVEGGLCGMAPSGGGIYRMSRGNSRGSCWWIRISRGLRIGWLVGHVDC